MHPVADRAPSHEGIVDQHKPILHPELENAARADDRVAHEVPRPALHGLEAEGVVLGVRDPVTPHPHVGKAVVGLQAVVRHVEDVVAVDVNVPLRVRDPIRHTGDAVVGDNVPAGVIQFDAFAADAALVRRQVRIVVAHDYVVGDVPIAARGLERDGVVKAVEAALRQTTTSLVSSDARRPFGFVLSLQVKSFEPDDGWR